MISWCIVVAYVVFNGSRFIKWMYIYTRIQMLDEDEVTTTTFYVMRNKRKFCLKKNRHLFLNVVVLKISCGFVHKNFPCHRRLFVVDRDSHLYSPDF